MPQYEVQPGDTLWDIAEKTTGDGNRWREIYQNNSDQIADPGTIQPGQVLAIPYDQPQSQPSPGGVVSRMGESSQPSYTAPLGPVQPSNAGASAGQPNRSSPTNTYIPTQGVYTPPPPPAPANPRPRPQPVPADKQVGWPMNAQMGVTITPPVQQGINAWEQRRTEQEQTQERVARLGRPTPVTKPPATVTWPAPPGVMQQTIQQRQAEPVTPSSYQGRFTDAQGNLVAPNAYRGYMGQPRSPGPGQAYIPTQGEYPAPPQQTYIPTQGQYPAPRQQQQATPRAVVVINQDGSQTVWDAETGQWTTMQPAGGSKGRPSYRPPQQQQPVPGPLTAAPLGNLEEAWKRRELAGGVNNQPNGRLLNYDGYTYNQVAGGYPPGVNPPSMSDYLRDMEYVPPYGMRGG